MVERWLNLVVGCGDICKAVQSSEDIATIVRDDSVVVLSIVPPIYGEDTMNTRKRTVGLLAVVATAMVTSVAGARMADAISPEEEIAICRGIGCDGGPRNCAEITITIGPPLLPFDITIKCMEP